MKTLFFIAVLAGAVYLIMQTPAGQAWLKTDESETIQQRETPQRPQIELQDELQKVQQISSQLAQSVEHKVTELAERLNQTQQAQIDQLETRIAELENELVMTRVADKQQASVSSGVVTLHPYGQNGQTADQVASPSLQPATQVNVPDSQPIASSPNNQLQRKRQARLQDIAQKMEMSSLQALVN